MQCRRNSLRFVSRRLIAYGATLALALVFTTLPFGVNANSGLPVLKLALAGGDGLSWFRGHGHAEGDRIRLPDIASDEELLRSRVVGEATGFGGRAGRTQVDLAGARPGPSEPVIIIAGDHASAADAGGALVRLRLMGNGAPEVAAARLTPAQGAMLIGQSWRIGSLDRDGDGKVGASDLDL